MAKRYVKASVPVETWMRLKEKNGKMNAQLKGMGVNRSIKMTKMIDAISRKSVWFDNKELLELARKKRRQQGCVL